MKKIILCAFTALMFGFESDAMMQPDIKDKQGITYTIATVPPIEIIQKDGKIIIGNVAHVSLKLLRDKSNTPLVISGTDSVKRMTKTLKTFFKAKVIAKSRK